MVIAHPMNKVLAMHVIIANLMTNYWAIHVVIADLMNSFWAMLVVIADPMNKVLAMHVVIANLMINYWAIHVVIADLIYSFWAMHVHVVIAEKSHKLFWIIDRDHLWRGRAIYGSHLENMPPILCILFELCIRTSRQKEHDYKTLAPPLWMSIAKTGGKKYVHSLSYGYNFDEVSAVYIFFFKNSYICKRIILLDNVKPYSISD